MSTYCKSFVFCLTLFLTLASSNARGQAALLLEEPYSYDGTFAGTGHSAVYLTRVYYDYRIGARRLERISI